MYHVRRQHYGGIHKMRFYEQFYAYLFYSLFHKPQERHRTGISWQCVFYINRDMNHDRRIRQNVTRILDILVHAQIQHMLSMGIVNVIPAVAEQNQYGRFQAGVIINNNGPRFIPIPPHRVFQRIPTYHDIYKRRHANRYTQNGCRIHQGPYGPLYINRMAGRYELRPRLPHHRLTRNAEYIPTCLAKHYPPISPHGGQKTPKLDTRHGSRLRLPVARH